MKRKDVSRLLKRMHKSNKQLDVFIQKAKAENRDSSLSAAADDEAVGGTGVRKHKFALLTPLEQINSHATHLHRVLGDAWACTAHTAHKVNLLLEHRMELRSRKRQLRRQGGE